MLTAFPSGTPLVPQSVIKIPPLLLLKVQARFSPPNIPFKGTVYRYGSLLLTVLAMLALSQRASAVIEYWDTSTTANLQGGTGTWNAGSTALWSTATSGSNPLVVWTNGNDAYFNSGTNTVTISGTVTVNLIQQNTTSTVTNISGGAITGTNNITVNGGSMTIADTTAVTLTPDASKRAVLTTGTGASLTINGNIGETAQTSLRIFGTAVTLGGNNTFTGGVQIFKGCALSVTNINAFGSGNILFSQFGDSNTTGTLNFNLAADATLNKTIIYTGDTSGTTSNSVFLNSNGVGALTYSGAMATSQLATSGLVGSVGALALNLGGTSTAANTFSGVIKDLGTGTNITSLVKQGSGTWILIGANTYTGATTVSAGVLNIQHATALGTSALGTSVASGAALQLQNNITVGAEALTLSGTGIANDGALRNISGSNNYGGLLTLGADTRINSDSGTLTLSNTGTLTGLDFNLTLGGSGNISLASIIGTGIGTLTKDGGGTLTLSGTNTYSGLTTVSAGALNFSSSGSLASGNALTVGASGTADFANANQTLGAVNNANTATNALNFSSSSGTVTLGSLSGLGNTRFGSDASIGTLSGGTVNLNGATNAINTLNGGTVNLGSGFALTVSDGTSAGTISGTSATLTKTTSGTLTFSGANTYTGLTTVSAGTLQLGNGGTTGSLAAAGAIVNNANLTINRSNAVVQGTDLSAAAITGTGSFTQAGSGTTTLNAANSYSGLTTVSAGVLNIQSATGLGTTAAGTSVATGAALQLQGGITVGAEALTLAGTGVSSDGALRSITGANTFGGTLTLGAASRINSDAGTLTLSNTGTLTGAGFDLTVGGAGDTVIAGILSTTTGGLAKDGAGTLTLNGANTFTGLTSVSNGALVIGTSGSLFSGNALTLGASGTADFANAGQTLGAVTNANTATNALNFSAASGTVTIGSLIGGGNTRFGSAGVVTGGIATGTVTSVGNLTANISGSGTTVTVGGLLTGDIADGTIGAGSLSTGTVSGGTTTVTGAAGITAQNNGTTTVGGVATIGTLSGGTTNLNGATSAITTLSGGTVNLSSGTALTVSGGTSAGAITGTGATLTKTSGSTLTLNAANTYTGLTTVSAGALNIGASGSLASGNALTVGGSGTANFANAGQTLGAVTNDNTATHALNFSAATGTVTLGSLTGGGNTRFGSAGVVTGGIASGTVTSVGNLTATISGSTTTVTVGGLLTGDIADGTIGAGSLSTGTVSGGTTTVTGAAGITAQNNGTTTVGGVATIGTLSGGTTNLNGATSAITTLSGGTVNLSSGTALTVSGGTSAGAITGTGATLTKTSGSTLTLNAANTYTGLTTVSAGALNIGASGSLASGNALTVGGSGTANFANAGQTLGAVTNDNTATHALNFSAATGTVTLGSLTGGGNTRFGSAGVVTGGIASGTVTSVGNLTATISGSTTTVTVGGLLTGDIADGTVGAGSLSAGTVSGGATTVTGAAGITTQTSGTTTVGGVATIGTLSGGTANLNGATSAITTLSGGTVNLSSGTALTVSGGTSAGTLTGGGSLTKASAGTLSLTGANSYTGTTTVSTGVLNIQNATALGSTGSGAGTTVVSGAALQLQGGITVGAEALTLSGSGIGDTGALRSISGNNTFGGTITLGASARINSDTAGDTLTLSNTGSFTIAGHTLTLGGAGDMFVYSAIGVGAGNLIKDGSGTVTLFGANTFTGTTTIDAGILKLGAANVLDSTSAIYINNVAGAVLDLNGFNVTLGSIAGGGALGGGISLGATTLTVGADNSSTTYASNLSGAGGLTKTGSGTLILSGTNGYLGTTRVSGGTLQAGGTSAFGTNSALVLDNTANTKLDLGGYNISIGSLAGGGTLGGNVELGSATLTTGGDGMSTVFTGTLSGTGGSLTKTGGGTLTLNGTNSFTGLTTVSAGALVIGASGSLASGNDLTLGGSGAATFTNANQTLGAVSNANTASNALNFSAATGTVTLGSLSGAGTTTFASTAAIGTLSAGTANLNGATSAITTLNGGTVNLGASTALTVSAGTSAGTITGGGSLTKTGGGILTLNSANTYTGLTTVSGGTLAIGSGGSLASGNALTVGGSGTANFANADQTLGAVSNANTASNALNFSATSGTVTLASLSGPGNTTFASVASIGTLAAGTVNLNGPTSAITTLNGGTVNLSSGTALTVSAGTSAGSIAGTGGTLTKTGGGTLTLSGTNSFTGATTVSAGTLAFNAAAALGTTASINLADTTTLTYTGGTATFDRDLAVTGGTGSTGTLRNSGLGTLTLSGTLTKDGTILNFAEGTFDVTGTISGVSAHSDLVVDHATVTLSHANTYTGPTYLQNAATLHAAVTGALPTGTRSDLFLDATGTGGSTLTLGADQAVASLTGATSSTVDLGAHALTVGTTSGSTTFAGTLGGTGGTLIKDGASTLSLTGTNSYTGGTTLQAGTLVFTTGGLGTTGTVQFSGDATLRFGTATTTDLSGRLAIADGVTATLDTGGNDLTFASAFGLGGTGGLTKAGVGTLTFTAAATYTGATTISAGTLQLGDGTTSSGSIAGDLVNNAVLVFANPTSQTYAGAISGAGTVVKTGAGSFVLTGTHSYTGATTINLGNVTLSSGALGGTDVTVGSGLTPTATAGNATLTIAGDYTLGTPTAGSLTISGGNTSGTPLGQGTLSLVDTAVNTLTLARTTGGATNLILGGTAGNAAKLLFELGATDTDKIVVNQNLILNAGGALLTVSQLTGTQLIDGTYDLLTFASTSTFNGAFTFAGGVTTLAAGGGRTFSLHRTTTAEHLQVVTVLNAANAYWSGTYDSSWSTLGGGIDTNWVNAPTAGIDPHQIPVADTNVYLTANSAAHFTTTTLDADFTINSLNFTGTGSSGTSALVLASGSSAHTLTLQATNAHGNVTGSGLTVEGGSGAHTISANLALGADQTWGNFSSNTLTVSGVISGDHALTLNGDFTFLGSAANTYSGLSTVASGTLSLHKDSGLNALAGDLDVDGGTVQWLASHQLANTALLEIDGGTVNLGACDETVGSVSLLFGSITGTTGVLSATTFDVHSGTISAILGGAGSLSKTTTGTVTLSAANTFTGGTTVSAGTLYLGVANALAATGAVNVAGGTLDIANHNQSVGAVTLTSGAITGTSGALIASSFGLESGMVSAILGGSGTNLTKTTSGTVTLTGANTYTGATTVSAGTLTLNSATGGGAAAHTSGVTIATGGTVALGAANQINAAANLTLNGGTMALHGFDQTLGTLDLNANSTLDLSGSAHLVFANSSALDWNSATLSIVNFSATTNALRFGTTNTGLTATQLGLIRFYDFGNIAGQIDANGYLAPLSGNYLNSGATDIVISSSITGTTTVTQSGTASTTLTGTNTSTGLASVSDGILVIGTGAGGNWAGNVEVGSLGMLKGSGTISGAIVVDAFGTYSPGNSPAIQHIGSLTVNFGGFVTIELDGATAGNGAGFHDQVVSAGAVTLHGGTLSSSTIFTGSTGYVPTLGTGHTIITGSAITGTFAAYNFAVANNATGVTWLPEYTATAVNLFAVPDNYATLAGLNPNQTRIGTALQSFRPATIDNRATLTDSGTLFNGLMRQDASGLHAAYNQLSPEKFTALSAASFQSASLFNSSVNQRSAELRRVGPASVSLNGVAQPAPAEECMMETVIEDGVQYQIAKAKTRRPWGYFAGATGALAELETGTDRLGYQSKTGSAYCGLDYALNANQSLGLVISQAFAEAEFSGDAGSAQTNTQRFGLFYDFHQDGFYLNSVASVGYSTYDTQRKVGFLGQDAHGETRGLSYGGQLSTGYEFKVGAYVFGPTASLAYDHAGVDAFGETGSAADLNVGRQEADSLTSHLGVHVSRPFEWKRIGWIPDLSLGVTRQHFNPSAISARFAAGGNAFSVRPQAGDSEFITPGASLTALLANGWSVRLGYEAILNQDSAEHRVNLSVNAGF